LFVKFQPFNKHPEQGELVSKSIVHSVPDAPNKTLHIKKIQALYKCKLILTRGKYMSTKLLKLIKEISEFDPLGDHIIIDGIIKHCNALINNYDSYKDKEMWISSERLYQDAQSVLNRFNNYYEGK